MALGLTFGICKSVGLGAFVSSDATGACKTFGMFITISSSLVLSFSLLVLLLLTGVLELRGICAFSLPPG